jgi:hypothetical protein
MATRKNSIFAKSRKGSFIYHGNRFLIATLSVSGLMVDDRQLSNWLFSISIILWLWPTEPGAIEIDGSNFGRKSVNMVQLDACKGRLLIPKGSEIKSVFHPQENGKRAHVEWKSYEVKLMKAKKLKPNNGVKNGN